MIGTDVVLAAWLAAGASLAVCLALVLTRHWHGRFTFDGTEGVQKFHVAPTPRVGGVGVVIGLVLACSRLDAGAARLLVALLVAGLPALASGLGEDLTGRVSVRVRLLATMASGALAWWLAGAALRRIDLAPVDALLVWTPASVLFTAFAVGGVANAINIIDGLHGLAAGVLVIALSALGLLAAGAGDLQVAALCLVVAGATLGFGLVNFPAGRIFLGDGGAYLLGYLLAALAVLVAMRNPQVSPWAALMACAYPILEVIFSVLRRMRRRLPPGHPDRLHLHSLIQRRIVRKAWPGLGPNFQNAAVSPLVWCLAAAPALCGLLFREQTGVLMALFASFAVLYALAYRRLVRFRAWRRGRPLKAQPLQG